MKDEAFPEIWHLNFQGLKLAYKGQTMQYKTKA